ncbi:MurR/RpiR family transcriptional regulator [Vibrio palustris]|uniref:HTH-type transcriptional regulator MurR n=1 Tax=Vibrio palustris TaxID=1918946 RepID=A0A1R4B3C0_9VIBR|nr:MurR/RpiR family transcriptional regulator [Vibrio palustris]SJL83414.1 HTH-type transcriptional regulator MurR [Vibrio palustris]
MNNDLDMVIAYSRVKFTRKENQIADYLLANPVPDKIEILAKAIDVSASSLTRFTKKLGCQSFKEFYYRYQRRLEETAPDIEEDQQGALHHEYVNLLQNRYDIFDDKVTQTIAEEIHRRPGIHVYGEGFSTLVAQDLKLRFRRLGKFVDIIHDTDSMDMYGPPMNANDLLLIISLNGRNERLIKYLSHLKERGVTIACMTSNKKSKMVSLSQYVLFTPSLNGEELTGLISPQFPLLMAVDSLYGHYVNTYRSSIDTWMATERHYLLSK